MPVDPQIQALLALRAKLPPLHSLSVADARVQMAARDIPGLRRPDVASVVNRDMQGPAGSLRIDGAVLHIDQYYAAARVAPELNVLSRLWEVAPTWWYAGYVAPVEVIDSKHEALVRFMTAVIKDSVTGHVL